MAELTTDESTQAMEKFASAMNIADFQVRSTSRDFVLLDRQVKSAWINLQKVNTSLMMLNRVINGIVSRSGAGLTTTRTNQQLTAAIAANTAASRDISRAMAANTAMLRTLTMVAAAGAASSVATFATSATRSISRSAATTVAPMKFPAYDISPDIEPIKKTSTEEQKQKRRDDYALKQHKKLAAETSKILGVPLYRHDNAEEDKTRELPLEMGGDKEYSREELLKTRLAKVDEQDRAAADKFEKEFGAAPGGDKPPGMTDDEWLKANNRFEGGKKSRRSNAMRNFNRQQERAARAAAAMAAGAAGASTPPLPGAGGLPLPGGSGSPGGASTGEETGIGDVLKILGDSPDWAKPGKRRTKAGKAQQDATQRGVTAPGGMALGGSGITGLLTNISVQITRLTNAALTNSTIYVHDTHCEKVLQGIHAAIGTGGPKDSSGSDKRSRDRDGLRGIAQSFGELSNAAAGASATMMAMVGLADPSTFSTFTGSVKLLAAEIGGVFSPFLRQAAFRVQELTETFATKLSPETKKMIGYIGAGIGVFGALSVGIRVLTGVFSPLIGIIWKTGAALLGMLFTPQGMLVASGIAAITAAVALATGNWNNLTNAIWNAGEAIAGLPKQGVDAALGMGAFANKQKPLTEQLAALPKGLDPKNTILSAKTPADIEKAISAIRTQEEDKIEAAKTRLAENAKDIAPYNEVAEVVRRERMKVLEKFGEVQQAENQWIFKPNYPHAGTVTSDTEQYKEFEKSIEASRDVIAKAISAAEKKFGYSFSSTSQFFDQVEQQSVQNDRGRRFWQMKTATGTPPGAPKIITTTQQEIASRGTTIKQLDALMKAFGVDGGYNPNGTPKKRGLEDFISPVQARQTDALSYRQSAQNAALNVEDTRTELVRKQLDALHTQNGTLDQMHKTIADGQREIAAALQRIQTTAP